MHPLALLVAVGTVVLTVCGGIGGDEGRAFVDDVRTTVPSTSSYPDEQLLAMAGKACAAGSRAGGVRVLRAYGGLTDADRRRIVRLARRTACPADG